MSLLVLFDAVMGDANWKVTVLRDGNCAGQLLELHPIVPEDPTVANVRF